MNEENTQTPDVRSAAAEGLPLGIGHQVLSSFATYALVAYVAGWAYWTSYLSLFQALWLVPHLSVLSLLHASAFPLLFFFAVLAYNIDETARWAKIDRSAFEYLAIAIRRPRLQFLLLQILVALMLTAVLIGYFLGFVAAAAGTATLVLTLASIEFMEDVMRQRIDVARRVRSALIFAILVGVGLPASVGILMAQCDKNPTYTTLPLVCTKEHPCGPKGENLRLLLSTGQQVFARDRNGAVVVVEWQKIEGIRR